MQDLASSNGYYRIRLWPKSAESSDDKDSSVTTFVKAVSLNFRKQCFAAANNGLEFLRRSIN